MSYLGPKVHIDLHQLKKNYQIVKSEVGEIPICLLYTSPSPRD